MQTHNWSGFAGILATIALLALPTPGTAADIPKAPDVADLGVLSIANTLDYAPFEFIGEDGEPTGAIIEMANAAADLMGVELDILRIPFPSMIPGLAADRFSVSWETFAPTEERLKLVDFVVFIQAGIVVSTLPENADAFADENSLCGKTIGVNAGTASDFTLDDLSEACVAAGQPAIEKSVFPEARDSIQAVLSDRIEARLDDATASGYFEATSGGQLVVVGDAYAVSPLGLAVRKGDTATAEMMRGVIQALMDNGTYADVMANYGLSSSMIDTARIIDSVDDI